MNYMDIKNILEKKNSEIEKILPLYDSPVKGLQFFILETIFNEDKIMPWFYCNYIQLEWTKGWCITFSMLQEYYVGYPFIDKQIFIRETVKDVNIIDFLIHNINCGWYTHLSLDEYYVPHKSYYKKLHFVHDNMICGYNLEQQFFIIYGYSMNSKLEISKISFQEFINAYNNVYEAICPNADEMQYGNLIFMIKKNLATSYEMDLDFMKGSIHDYLIGTPYVDRLRMFKNSNDNKVYGINILKKLIRAFEEGEQNIVLDKRLTTTVYEHCLIMFMRVRYLMENNYIKKNNCFLKKFEEMIMMSQITRNLQLYYSLSSHKSITLLEIASCLKEIQGRQKELFGELLYQL